MNLHRNSSLTLTELITAVSLMSLIFLAIAAIDVASRRFYYKTDKTAVVTTTVGFLQDHMAKNILQATGYLGDSGIILIPDHDIRIRIDKNITPADFSDDTWMRYWRNANEVRYYPDFGNNPGTYEVIARNILQPANPGGIEGLAITQNSSDPDFYWEIKITGRYTPTGLEDPYENPQVRITSNVSPRTMSAN